jgi:acetyl esterase/lipase
VVAPSADPPLPPTVHDGITRFSEVTYGQVPGFRPLVLDVWVPPAPSPPPVVVWVHGGGWREGDRRWLPPTMGPESLFTKVVDAGLALVTVDYRLSGEAPFPAPLHDVQAAIGYVRRHASAFGVDAGRIGIGGESAGAHLAALAAFTPGPLEGSLAAGSSRVDCAVLWYGFFDARGIPLTGDDVLLAMLGGPEPERAERASPITYVDADAPPVLLLHGVADTVVPFAQSARLHDALVAAGVPSELVAVPGAEHCFDGSPDIDALLDRSVAFWREHLLPAG